MALTTLEAVRLIPGLDNPIALSDAYLQSLVDASSDTIKHWTKQNLELQFYTEYHSGNEHPNLVLKQYPVWSGVTQISDDSDGVTLPTSTINVVSTLGPDGTTAFNPVDSGVVAPTIAVQTGLTTWTVVSYTGVTFTSFTGCSGGTGTLSSNPQRNSVSQPIVWIDQGGYWGQTPPGVSLAQGGAGPFAPGTIQVMGVNFGVNLNLEGQQSRSGLLTRVGGYGMGGWIGSYPSWGGFGNRGKLASARLPCWPQGIGNIKVQYTAGYRTIPNDLAYCANTLVAALVRNQPKGGPLASESLGAYSYSMLAGSSDPDIGEVRRTLSRYCEVSW